MSKLIPGEWIVEKWLTKIGQVIGIILQVLWIRALWLRQGRARGRGSRQGEGRQGREADGEDRSPALHQRLVSHGPTKMDEKMNTIRMR